MLDLGTDAPKNHAHLSDLINFSLDDSYGGGHGPVSTRSHIFGSSGLPDAADEEEGGSGASTPPLWGSESPESRQRNYAALSPWSRTEAIARGQMELMEMVRNMPEACYELSLKDLVEVNRSIGQEILLEGQNGNYARYGGARVQGQRHRDRQMVRRGSLGSDGGGGFLLKMVLPVPWRARKKKNRKIKGLDANSENGGVDQNLVPEKEWWKMRGSVLASACGDGTESGGSLNGGSRKSSNGSSSSSNSWSSCSDNSSTRRHESDTGCWSFIRAGAKAGC